jgi:hypothetical protein
MDAVVRRILRIRRIGRNDDDVVEKRECLDAPDDAGSSRVNCPICGMMVSMRWCWKAIGEHRSRRRKGGQRVGARH